jgi:hypothetical protein
MPYRSRKQDRDQAIEKRIADSYKGRKRTKPQHKPDTKALEIMAQNPGTTYSEALDVIIQQELQELKDGE